MQTYQALLDRMLDTRISPAIRDISMLIETDVGTKSAHGSGTQMSEGIFFRDE